MGEWALQDAKAHFSDLVRRTRSEGPQVVTVRGERAAVLVSAEEYERLTRKPFVPASEALLSGPEWPQELYEILENRNRELPRDFDL